jgi:C4-type Zn-finger protein
MRHWLPILFGAVVFFLIWHFMVEPNMMLVNCPVCDGAGYLTEQIPSKDPFTGQVIYTKSTSPCVYCGRKGKMSKRKAAEMNRILEPYREKKDLTPTAIAR